MSDEKKPSSQDGIGRAIDPKLRAVAGGGDSTRGRFSVQRKQDVVLRMARGEDMELLSRELGVTAGTLSEWRDRFFRGGSAALKFRLTDDRDEMIARLQSKIGEQAMVIELLEGKIEKIESGFPLGRRRSKR
jgi:transposase